MRLATPSAVLAVLNIQSSTGSLASAESALDATVSLLEGRLDTQFGLASRLDHFFLSDSPRMRKLRLTASFIRKVVVTVNSAGSFSGGTVLPSTDYFVDVSRGVITLVSPIGYVYVSVSYTSGFDVDPANPTIAVGAPDTLVEAHKCLACSAMQLNPANVAKDKAKALGTASIDGYQQQAYRAIEPYVRPRSSCVWPDATVTK